MSDIPCIPGAAYGSSPTAKLTIVEEIALMTLSMLGEVISGSSDSDEGRTNMVTGA